MQSRTCPICNSNFSSPIENRTYCSVRCRNTAHRRREKVRDAVAQPNKMSDEDAEAIMFFVKPITDPTEGVIRATAQLMIEAQPDKPSYFRGVVPTVVGLPPNITFMQDQQKNWIMFYDKH